MQSCVVVVVIVHIVCVVLALVLLITKVQIFRFESVFFQFLLAHHFDWISLSLPRPRLTHIYGMGSFIQPTYKPINYFINSIQLNSVTLITDPYKRPCLLVCVFAFIHLENCIPYFLCVSYLKLCQNWISNITIAYTFTLGDQQQQKSVSKLGLIHTVLHTRTTQLDFLYQQKNLHKTSHCNVYFFDSIRSKWKEQ